MSSERRGIIGEASLRGAPDLVIDWSPRSGSILSPSTAGRDRTIKLELYERQGVREYWIVDPAEGAVDVWRFGSESVHERFTETLPVRLGAERVGEIDVRAVFAPGF